MEVGKKVFGAFIVGGCIGLVSQAIIMILGGILGPDSTLVTPLMLVVMGIIGSILVVGGVYQKLEEIGGFGAIMPFCGLAAGVAGAICGIRGSGAPLGAAILNGLKAFIILIVIASAICVVIGVGVSLIA